MSDDVSPKPVRPWRVIAEEASNEYDAAKLSELIRELDEALQQQGLAAPDDESKKKTA
jgi:hypothetical protein